MATNKAASYGISFSEALKVDTLGPNQYQTNVSPDYCYGAYANGGFLVSLFQSTITKHFRESHSNHGRPYTITVHVEILRQTIAGVTILQVENVKLGRATSTVHIRMFQKGVEKAAAYATIMTTEGGTGVSYPTGYTLLPTPCPVDVSRLSNNQDPSWIPFTNPYSTDSFGKARTHLRYFIPRDGPPHPSITDEWITPVRPGERFTNDIIGFVVDQWPHFCENFRPGSPHSAMGIIDRVEKASSQTLPYQPNKWETPFYYPTLHINVEFKKLLPPEGARWLFVRARAKQIKDGKFDVEVVVLDDEGEIVALSNHVALIVDNSRFSTPNRRGENDQNSSKL